MTLPPLPSLSSLWTSIKHDLRAIAGIRRLPSISQWKRLFPLLTQRERVAILLALGVFLFSFSVLSWSIVNAVTVAVPRQGGNITEGMVGFPRFINPIYADARDVDRDITQLVFSGIMRMTPEGSFVPDLAKEVDIREDGKVFDIYLKPNAVWHDGRKLSAQDVAFTIQTIQNPAINSPLRAEWIGVEAEVITEEHVRLRLQESYAPFLERLASLKIIPSHIWQDINPENFPLSWYNFQAIGTGPYRVRDIVQGKTGTIERLYLQKNSSYHGKSPYLASVTIRFFASEESLLQEAKRGDIDSFALSSPASLPQVPSRFVISSFSLPRYFAVFFNQNPPNQDSLIKKLAVRQALGALTNREALVQEALIGYGNILYSPLLPDTFSFSSGEEKDANYEEALSALAREGYVQQNGILVKSSQESNAITSILRRGSQGSEVRTLQECLAKQPDVYPDGTVSGIFGPATEQAVIAFQEKYRNEILAPSNLSKGTGEVGASTREKLEEICSPTDENLPKLSFTLTTVDRSPLREVAQLLVSQWERLGIDVVLQFVQASEISNKVLKPRAFEALLFGNLLGIIPDPFPFWHSSQRHDPGRNLSQYESREADRLLETLRKESNEEKRREILEDLQDVLLKDLPAIVLHDLDYLYAHTPQIKGIQHATISVPSQRFSFLPDWYIKTKRTWK